jgi:hypothetical protein
MFGGGHISCGGDMRETDGQKERRKKGHGGKRRQNGNRQTRLTNDWAKPFNFFQRLRGKVFILYPPPFYLATLAL